MTPSRYLFARIGLAFGIQRRQRRMSDAATEMHLLREAEQILGESVWERVEDVEELGVEYWNLRKLIKEREEIRIKLDACEDILASAHEQRAAILGAKSDPQQNLEEKRARLLTDLENMARDRDAIVQRAREIRRVYDGLKMKVEVIQSGEGKDLEATRKRMADLKEQFTDLKHQRDLMATKIADGDAKLDLLDGELNSERQRHRSEASEAFQQIGQANRDISALKAQYGLLDTQMRQLFSEIGRHISRHARASERCRLAAKGHMPMVDVMQALRQSIAMNHRLAGM